jgi:hypothetical protein
MGFESFSQENFRGYLTLFKEEYMPNKEIEEINGLLNPKSDIISTQELQKTLKDKSVKSGYHFVIRTNSEGPWELIALYVNGARFTNAPINTSNKSITLDLTDKIKVEEMKFPLYLRWMAYYPSKQTKFWSATFFIKNGIEIGLGEKKNIKSGKFWVSTDHMVL